MPQFETPQDATAKLGGVFQDAVTDETLYRGFQQLNAVVRLQLKAPSTQITVKAKKGEPGVVELGPSKLNPDVIVRMDADTAHGWLSGEVNPTVALSKGQMRVTGPVDAILRLVPVAPALAEQYKAVLENGGRTTEEPVVEAAPDEAPDSAAAGPGEPPAVADDLPAESAEGEPAQESPAAKEVVEGVPAAEEIVADAPSVEEILDSAPAVEDIVAEAPVAEEVVADAPEPPAPSEAAEPAVAVAPQGEPDAVDAIGADEAVPAPEAVVPEPEVAPEPEPEPEAAAEPAVEEPVVTAGPAVEEPVVAQEPATESAAAKPTAAEPETTEAAAETDETPGT